jgi:hypothetical protein
MTTVSFDRPRYVLPKPEGDPTLNRRRTARLVISPTSIFAI